MPGTGLYNAKAVPAHNDDTQIGGPAGQVITLTVGGLGVTGWEGGYVVNTNAAETRAIVSHTDMTVTLEGNLANWLNGHDLDIYDAWATVQGTCDQLLVDQAAVVFTAEQYIEIYDGTYDENVYVSGLKPKALYPLYIKAASGESAAIITNASQGAGTDALRVATENTRVADLELRNVRGGGFALQAYRHNLIVSGCLFEGSATASNGFTNGTYSFRIQDCKFQGFTLRSASCGSGLFLRCSFHGGEIYNVTSFLVGASFISCVFDGITQLSMFTSATNFPPPRGVYLYQCVFYNCTDVFLHTGAAGTNQIVAKVCNCIFRTITNYAFDGKEARGIIDSDYNDFFNCGKIARFENVNYDNLAAWQAYTDIDGNSPDANSQETDPLLTNPGADDFTLQATSPCKWAGMGSGVKKDIAGVAFDPYSPDQGAHSSGLHIKVVQPRW